MLFRSKKHAIGAFTICALLFLSFSSQHPAGNSGAPGDGLCSNCHSGAGFTGSVDISGLPGTVDPAVTYNVTVTLNVSTGTPIRGGFQIVALQDANDNNAGDWTNNSSSSSLIISGGREYFGHAPFKNFGGGNSVEWDADWTPPDVMDDVTFYAVGNFANGNGGTSGDVIVTSTETVTVLGADPLNVEIDLENNVSCFDGTDGSASAVAGGGTPPYSFSWDSGENTATAVNLDAGNHSVTVTDDDDNTGEADIIISEPDIIEIDPEIINVSCFGDDDGEAQLNIFGGVGNYDCEWSNGVGLGCDQDGLDPGLYFITITDGNNCEIVEELEIGEPNPLLLNLSSTDESASGANDGTAASDPNGGTAPYNFNWSNGVNENGNGSTIEDLAAGTYSITVTDQNGCVEEGDIEVMAGACNIDVNPQITHISCYGDSSGMIMLNTIGGADPITYIWSNGAATENLDNLGPGTYSVEIIDNGGCSLIVNEMVVEEPDSLNVHTISIQNPSCEDSQDGEIIVNVSGGAGNYTLTWSNGVTNDTIETTMDTLINIPDTLSNLGVGIYTYILSDGNDCLLSDSISLFNGDTLAPILVIEQGSIYIDEFGFGGPGEFADVDAGSSDNCGIDSVSFTTPIFTCNDIASYNIPIEIFDSAGNSTSGTATINVMDTIPPIIDCSAIGDIVTNSCEPVNYALPTVDDNCNVAGIELIEGLPSGSIFPAGTTGVTYRAVDECNNTDECSFSVTVNIDLELTVAVTEVSCPGESDGIIAVSGSGGTAPYTFSITGDIFEDLGSGTYIVTLEDSGNCSAVDTIVISEPQILQVDLLTSNPSCFNASDGTVNLDTLGDNLSWEFDGDPGMLAAGDYDVTITDAGSGCIVSESFSIDQPEELGFENVVIQDPSCYFSDDCNLDFEVVGGTGMVNVDFENEGDDCDGPVIVTLEDENGCMLTETFILTRPDSISISNVVINPASDVNSGAVTLDVSGGSGPYTFSWTDENGNVLGTEQNISLLFGGTYFLEVIDSNGCSQIFEFFIDTDVATIDLDKNNNLVLLSPNPAFDHVRLRFIDQSPSEVKVYNIESSLMEDFKVENEELRLDVSKYASGIYIIAIEYENVLVVKRFLKI